MNVGDGKADGDLGKMGTGKQLEQLHLCQVSWILCRLLRDRQCFEYLVLERGERDFFFSNTHLAGICSLALSPTGQEKRCQALLNPVTSREVNLPMHSTYSFWERHLYTCESWQLQWPNIFLFFYSRFYPQVMCMGVFFNQLIKQQYFSSNGNYLIGCLFNGLLWYLN